MFQAAERLLRALNNVSFFDLYFKQDIVPYISVNPHISCRFRIYTLQRGRLRAAVQRGRLRAAALSRRRKLRFSAACQSNPPALLRYVSSSQKIFASQIFFGNPVDLIFRVVLSVACAWLRRREAPPLVYAKHTPWCQTVNISKFIIVLPIIFLDRISSI